MVRCYFDQIGDRGRVITISLGEETLVVVSHDFSAPVIRASDGLRPDLPYCPFYLYPFLTEQCKLSCLLARIISSLTRTSPSLYYKTFRLREKGIVRIVIQRIREARVTIDGEITAKIGPGLCVFLGVAKGDTQEDADYLADKAVQLRIFEDHTGKFDRSLLEVHGEILVVSEFTLYGDCSKGRRPSFSQAAPPREAETLYHYFVERLKDYGLEVATGKFQSKMEVSITNDGPVTLLLESR